MTGSDARWLEENPEPHMGIPYSDMTPKQREQYCKWLDSRPDSLRESANNEAERQLKTCLAEVRGITLPE